MASNGVPGGGFTDAAVLACFREHGQFVMCAHEKPDGDVLGSGLALGLALKAMGKDVIYFLDDEVPKNLRFLPDSDLVQRSFEGVKSDAVFVFFDMSDQSRAGEALGWVPPEQIVNIDHHLGNKRFGRWNYVLEAEAATGVLVLNVIAALGQPITPGIATCLLTTLISDTGCFLYSNARPQTLRLAAALVNVGADKDLITEQLYQTRSFSGQKVLGRTLDAAVMTDDGICYSVVSRALLEEFGATHEDLEDVVGALRAVDRCEVAALLKESPDGNYRLSLRSRGRFNVMAAAKKLDGGGHFRAAGATLPGPLPNALSRTLAAVRTEMAAQIAADRAPT
ncbi:MAG: DHH family phosphoesterase [Candidatus Eremiobacter antarcticus]|nr:bifunctional oligoribonuclease/PAP phosphatase NrnA [Candidatus Eremiobacteraeota bacterium]MBC5807570.1 bifunctional oligoribonuclease/PAP phosphatase NrnA [Candidatus Eremiobacteraeota bacterium]